MDTKALAEEVKAQTETLAGRRITYEMAVAGFLVFASILIHWFGEDHQLLFHIRTAKRMKIEAMSADLGMN
jgi:hypothetical protein